jgi:Domain of unknown function (DUF6249)
MRPHEIIPLIAMLIPIIAIVMGIGIGMLAVFLNYRKRVQMFELFHKERLAAIDKGIELAPIPEEFFSDNGKPASPHGTLLAGLIFTFTGLGLFLTLHAYHPDAALYALIPVSFGLAFLIFYFTVGKKQAEAIEARRQAHADGVGRSATLPT